MISFVRLTIKLTEPNFEWINNTDAFNEVLDRANENKFLDDIMSGKINKYNAAKEYGEKIRNNENLLRSYKGFSKSKNAKEIAGIINDVKNDIFGCLLPSELEDNVESIDIRGMLQLETEKEAAERQKDKV